MSCVYIHVYGNYPIPRNQLLPEKIDITIQVTFGPYLNIQDAILKLSHAYISTQNSHWLLDNPLSDSIMILSNLHTP